MVLVLVLVFGLGLGLGLGLGFESVAVPPRRDRVSVRIALRRLSGRTRGVGGRDGLLGRLVVAASAQGLWAVAACPRQGPDA